MKLEASTIEEYFDVAGERGDDLRHVDRIIIKTAPALKRQLFTGPSIAMIRYGEMDCERKSGSGVWPLIGMAAQKQHIGLYIAAVKDGETPASHYERRLGKTNNGRNCIRFRRMADIDPEELANPVRDAVAWAEVQDEKSGRNCATPMSND